MEKEIFYAPLKERFLLTHKESPKQTYHLVLDLKGSGMRYAVGDCVGIYPQNDEGEVESLMHSLGVAPTDTFYHAKNNRHYSAGEFLKHHANLAKINKNLLELIAAHVKAPEAKEFLSDLLKPELKEKLKSFLAETSLSDLSEKMPLTVPIEPFCNALLPLLPRFYSIASSQKAVGDEVHLTVGLTQYEDNEKTRLGTCSHYLCNLAQPLSKIPIFHHPAKEFLLPPESYDKPLIMVGPGTGIAPFRGFMQERVAAGSKENWLFFGEWTKEHHFYYGSYWEKLSKEGFLKVSLAFSREQSQKIYVQDRMEESGRELFAWLQRGAYFYICGDAAKMAKGVHAALLNIIQKEGCFTQEEAKEYLKQLKIEGRYRRDVY